MTQGRITRQITEYGDASQPYRVWVARAVGIIDHHYVPSVRAAVDLLTDSHRRAGIAAGLEEREAVTWLEWHEWYDDRGCDVNEIIYEAGGEPVVLLDEMALGLILAGLGHVT